MHNLIHIAQPPLGTLKGRLSHSSTPVNKDGCAPHALHSSQSAQSIPVLLWSSLVIPCATGYAPLAACRQRTVRGSFFLPFFFFLFFSSLQFFEGNCLKLHPTYLTQTLILSRASCTFTRDSSIPRSPRP